MASLTYKLKSVQQVINISGLLCASNTHVFIYLFLYSKKHLLSIHNEEGALADLGKNATAVQHQDGQELE